MRGEHIRQETMFTCVVTEARVPERHPCARFARPSVDRALTALDAEFEALCTHTGRPSIPPEYLLRATLLQILYSVRSGRACGTGRGSVVVMIPREELISRSCLVSV